MNLKQKWLGNFKNYYFETGWIVEHPTFFLSFRQSRNVSSEQPNLLWQFLSDSSFLSMTKQRLFEISLNLVMV